MNIEQIKDESLSPKMDDPNEKVYLVDQSPFDDEEDDEETSKRIKLDRIYQAISRMEVGQTLKIECDDEVSVNGVGAGIGRKINNGLGYNLKQRRIDNVIWVKRFPGTYVKPEKRKCSKCGQLIRKKYTRKG